MSKGDESGGDEGNGSSSVLQVQEELGLVPYSHAFSYLHRVIIKRQALIKNSECVRFRSTLSRELDGQEDSIRRMVLCG